MPEAPDTFLQHALMLQSLMVQFLQIRTNVNSMAGGMDEAFVDVTREAAVRVGAGDAGAYHGHRHTSEVCYETFIICVLTPSAAAVCAI